MNDHPTEVTVSTSRRRLLKGIAASGGGALAARLLTAGDALAAEPASSVVAPHEGSRLGEGRLLPASPGLRYIYLSGLQGFVPNKSTQTYSEAPIVGGSIYQVGGTAACFWGALHLPHGAMLSEITWSVIRNDAAAQELFLWRSTPSTAASDQIANALVPAMSASVQNVNMSFAPVVIDTAQNFYGLFWCPGTAGLTHQLYGVRVGYHVNPELVFLDKPIRLLDTRPGQPAGINPGAPLAAGTTFDLQVTGTVVGGINVPPGARGVFGNVTVTNEQGPGFLTLFPTGASLPTVSTINYSPGANIANAVQVGLNGAGKFSIFVSTSGTDVIFDAAGYIT